MLLQVAPISLPERPRAVENPSLSGDMFLESSYSCVANMEPMEPTFQRIPVPRLGWQHHLLKHALMSDSWHSKTREPHHMVFRSSIHFGYGNQSAWYVCNKSHERGVKWSYQAWLIANNNGFYAELKNMVSEDLVNSFASILTTIIIETCVSMLFDSVAHSKCPPK